MGQLARLPKAVWAVAIGFVLIAVVAGAWMVSVRSRGLEAQQHLLAARSAGVAEVSDVGAPAVSQLSHACDEAARADALLRDVSGQVQAVLPLVDALGSVPGVGSRARGQAAALETGTQLAAAGTALCSGMEPLAALLDPNATAPATGSSSTRGALRALLNARPTLVEAAYRLDQTLVALRDASDDDLDASARASMQSLRERLPGMAQTLRDTTSLLDLLGASGERRFLLVSQNPDELRATGGYIGSAGVLAVSDGDVRLVEYGTSRAYDTPASMRAVTPAPFDSYLGDYWEFAGANWWVSFPDVARQLEYFYALARPGQSIDGVVALDQSGLQRLLEAVGPVEVPEYGEMVGADDVQAALDRHVHAGDGSDEVGRKQFTAALSAAVLQRVLNAPQSQVSGLVRAVRRALDEQHLLVAVADPAAAGVLARRHWDAALLPASGDALMVVETEVGASKQSQMVKRTVNYAVDLGPDPHAQLSMTYTNLATPEQRPDVVFMPTYYTFVRAYAPAGAELLGADGFVGQPTAYQECGRTVFGGKVSVARDGTTQVALKYRLPAQAANPNGYDLLVQQQPGVPPGQLTVNVTAPAWTASVLRDNNSGFHYHWQFEGGTARDVPLPTAPTGGCGLTVVNATSIAAPTWLDIPAAKVSAAVVDLGVDEGGSMEAPSTPDVIGWYRMSARAGQPGNSVFSGHVDWGRNTAVFWGLRDLARADPILVRGADGVQHRYRVESNRVVAREDGSAAELVRGSPGAILTLITCDGIYDQKLRDYSGRRIVRAVLDE
jgi:LPXTG-site transpeptidase (sortase) family protein